MIARALLIGVLIALAEVVQGFLRVKYLNRRVGDRRARQIGVLTGSGIILIIAWFTVPWIRAGTSRQLLCVGALWLALMLALDIGFGWYVFHASWERLLAEFDLRRGGLLGIGMFVLFVAPLLVAKLRGMI